MNRRHTWLGLATAIEVAIEQGRTEADLKRAIRCRTVIAECDSVRVDTLVKWLRAIEAA